MQLLNGCITKYKGRLFGSYPTILSFTMINLWTIISNPLDQFVVRPLFGNFNLGINTFTLDTLLVACVTFWVFYLLILANKNLSHLYTFAIGPALETLSYGAVVGAKRYRPLYVFVFVLIAMSNLMGMIPFSLTSTSFAVMTFFAGATMFIGINIIALASYNWKFVNLFLPSGAPLAIAPFLIIIETISYFARVMSLSIRLFANLLAGHALMKIIGTFVWSTPLIAAALINSLRPIADTRLGLAENFQVMIEQISNLWYAANEALYQLTLDGDIWLTNNGILSYIGLDSATNVILSYVATFAVVFVIIGALLFMLGHYLHDEISTPWTEFFSEYKNSIWFKPIWMLYGFRAWLSSRLSVIQPGTFAVQRQPGVAGMLGFTWAAVKHSTLHTAYSLLRCVLRPTTNINNVSLSQISGWNTYVAPVFTSAFWWIIVAIDLTLYFAHMIKFIGFTEQIGITLTWNDVLTSRLILFGPFGMGLIIALVLSFLIIGDLLMSGWKSVAPNSNAKAVQFFSGPACKWMDAIGAILVGLLAGWLQVTMYYNLFAMAYRSTVVPESVVFSLLVRLSHNGTLYFILFVFLIWIAYLVTEQITDSMDSSETRPIMKYIWVYGPIIFATAVLGLIFWYSISWDVLFSGMMETHALKVATTSSDEINWSDPFDLWDTYRWSGAMQVAWFVQLWHLMYDAAAISSGNIYADIYGALMSGVYVYLTFVVDALSTFGYYLVSEIDSIVISGLNSLIGLVALIALPLITPLAWSFLLAITGLELVIALLQAYVFVTLSSMYLNDAIKLH